MNQIFVCFLLFFLINLTFQSEPAYSVPTFEDYLRRFNKTYSGEELEKRKKLYSDNVAKFKDINSYIPGVNQFTDWTPDEFKRLLGATINDRNTTPPIVKSQIRVSRIAPPTSLDWRTSNAVTPVRDQGSCGSCWAFAATAYAESKIIIDGRYTNTVDLAEQFVFQCSASGDCGGGSTSGALSTLLHEVPFEVFYPYNFSATYDGICEVQGVQIGETADLYYNLNAFELIELVRQRPVVVRVAAGGWGFYASGVFSCGLNDTVNHAVLLVGYDADSWLIKNSWADTWGDSGYIRINRTNGVNCSIGIGVFRTFEGYFVGILSLAAAISFAIMI